MTKVDLQKLIDDVNEPLSWDCRGEAEEYELVDMANTAFAKIVKLLEKYVEPNLA